MIWFHQTIQNMVKEVFQVQSKRNLPLKMFLVLTKLINLFQRFTWNLNEKSTVTYFQILILTLYENYTMSSLLILLIDQTRSLKLICIGFWVKNKSPCVMSKWLNCSINFSSLMSWTNNKTKICLCLNK